MCIYMCVCVCACVSIITSGFNKQWGCTSYRHLPYTRSFTHMWQMSSLSSVALRQVQRLTLRTEIKQLYQYVNDPSTLIKDTCGSRYQPLFVFFKQKGWLYLSHNSSANLLKLSVRLLYNYHLHFKLTWLFIPSDLHLSYR